MQKLLARSLVVMFSVFFSLSVSAKKDDINIMMSGIENKKSTPALLDNAIRKGQERAALCNHCHGANGNSKKPDVPNLAGQNPVYLLNQIEKFADGSRINFVMNTLSKNFTRQDKENLALFYASLKVNPSQADAQLVARGKPVYETHCVACHGVTAMGQADFARLAGQQAQYVENTLLRFKNKSAGKASKRSNQMMEAVVSKLTAEDIKAVAAYISQLK